MTKRMILMALVLGSVGCGPERPDTGDAGPTVDSEVPELDGGGRADAGAPGDGAVPTPCGNGELDPGEECDDGNEDDADDCTNACRVRCAEDATRGCGSDVGECSMGVEACVGGVFGACEGATEAGTETCNGLDDDCDGATDEGCDCEEGTSRACGVSEGVCEEGTQSCVDGAWGTCEGGVAAGTEACGTGLDEDCDGDVDEACPTLTHEGFESGDLGAFPWETSGPHPWIVVASEGRGGTSAARTHPDHAANETSTLSITLSVRSPGTISFWTKLETEDAHFELTFSIDSSVMQTSSGVADWTRYEYPVSAGVHTFEWRYTRDDFISTEHPLRNAVWLDDVELPLYNRQPPVPSGLWPFDDARIAEVRPALRWQSADPDAGDTTIFEVELGADPTFAAATSSGELTSATFTPTADLASGTYWWRVRAKDDFDDTWGAWTAPHAFTVDPEVIRPSWLQRTGAQLVRGATPGAVVVVDDGLETIADVVVTTPYDDGTGRNFVTVRRAFGTDENTVYTTHAPLVGYEHHGYSWGSTIDYQYDGGFRFQGVPIPAGAAIESASLCLMQCFNCGGYDVRKSSAMMATITADRVANASVWPNSGTVMTGYSPTSASVAWSLTTELPHDTCAETSDVSAILQEVVDQPGWASGNAVRFLLEDAHGVTGGGVGEYYNQRLFYSRDNELRVHFPAQATVVSSPIRFADIAGATRWDKVQWAGEGDVRVRVLDADGDVVPAADLAGNDVGFTDRTIPIWGLDPVAYPSIRLQATLTRAGATGNARLDQWEVSWGTDLLWEFDVDGDAMGWVYGPVTAGSTVDVSDGVLRVDGDGADPNLRQLGMYVPAADFDGLEIVLRTGNTLVYDVVAASWANEAGGFALHRRESEPVFLLAEQTVLLDLLDETTGMGAWTGTIANLRVEPVEAFDGGSGWFEIERIRLIAR